MPLVIFTSKLDWSDHLLSDCTAKSLKTLQLLHRYSTKRSCVSLNIKLQVLFLTDKVLNGLTPLCSKEVMVPYYSIKCLSPQVAGLLVGPRISKSNLGGRFFSYQAHVLWNQLPAQIHGADTHSLFEIRLKSFLFDKAYSQGWHGASP